MTLNDRAAATERTKLAFIARPFDWTRQATCVHLVRRQLLEMGHQVPPVPTFRTPIGAKRALTKRGWSTVAEMVDAQLPRIHASEAIVGDILELASSDMLGGGLVVAVGNGRAMGYLEGSTALTILQPRAFGLAWRA